jgi:hypothetical protein
VSCPEPPISPNEGKFLRGPEKLKILCFVSEMKKSKEFPTFWKFPPTGGNFQISGNCQNSKLKCCVPLYVQLACQNFQKVNKSIEFPKVSES